MVDSTLTVSISRSVAAGGPTPLVFSAALDSNELGVVSYQAPAEQRRNTYAPDSVDVDGSEPIAASWQQAILGFDWVRDEAASETEVQASRVEVRNALGQFSYTVTTVVAGAPAEVWAADGGTQTPSPRTYEDLVNSNPVYAVTIPVRPIPGS